MKIKAVCVCPAVVIMIQENVDINNDDNDDDNNASLYIIAGESPAAGRDWRVCRTLHRNE